MKKLSFIVLACILTLSVVGCGSDDTKGSDSETSEKSGASKSNDTAYLDYINQIELGDSLEDINKVIGSEGEVQSDDATYVWESGNGGFTAIFKAGDTTSAISLSVNYDNKDVVNKNVKIKDLNSLKSQVRDGMHYDDFKEFLGGEDGILVSKSAVTKGYVWRSTNGAVVNAAFTLDDNICNSFTGTEK